MTTPLNCGYIMILEKKKYTKNLYFPLCTFYFVEYIKDYALQLVKSRCKKESTLKICVFPLCRCSWITSSITQLTGTLYFCILPIEYSIHHHFSTLRCNKTLRKIQLRDIFKSFLLQTFVVYLGFCIELQLSYNALGIKV